MNLGENMRKIIGLVIVALALASPALADTFSVTTATPTIGNIYGSASSRPLTCQNIGASNLYMSLDGTVASSTNGYLLVANGGQINIDQANAPVTAIASGGTTTLVCSVGTRLTVGAAASSSSGAGGTFRSWSTGASAAVVSNSVANVFPFTGVGTAVATTSEGLVSQVAPTVATLKNLTCVLTTAGGVVTVAGGTSYVVALRQQLATSAMTCTILAAASSCTDTTHSITTAINDQLDFIDTPAGTPTALVVKCSLEIDI